AVLDVAEVLGAGVLADTDGEAPGPVGCDGGPVGVVAAGDLVPRPVQAHLQDARGVLPDDVVVLRVRVVSGGGHGEDAADGAGLGAEVGDPVRRHRVRVRPGWDSYTGEHESGGGHGRVGAAAAGALHGPELPVVVRSVVGGVPDLCDDQVPAGLCAAADLELDRFVVVVGAQVAAELPRVGASHGGHAGGDGQAPVVAPARGDSESVAGEDPVGAASHPCAGGDGVEEVAGQEGAELRAVVDRVVARCATRAGDPQRLAGRHGQAAS